MVRTPPTACTSPLQLPADSQDPPRHARDGIEANRSRVGSGGIAELASLLLPVLVTLVVGFIFLLECAFRR